MGFYSTDSIVDGNWHFCVSVHNPLVDSAYCYLDGIYNGQGGSPAEAITTVDLVSMGNWSPDGDGDYTGILDDIRVYNRMLTAEEIEYLYNENGWE